MPAVSHPQRKWDISFVIIVRLQNTVHGMFHRKKKMKTPTWVVELAEIWNAEWHTLHEMLHSSLRADTAQVFCHRVLVLKFNVPELIHREEPTSLFFITRQWRIDIHTLSKCWSHLKNSEVIPLKRQKREREKEINSTEQSNDGITEAKIKTLA